jgi:hypothetical protein
LYPLSLCRASFVSPAHLISGCRFMCLPPESHFPYPYLALWGSQVDKSISGVLSPLFFLPPVVRLFTRLSMPTHTTVMPPQPIRLPHTQKIGVLNSSELS